MTPEPLTLATAEHVFLDFEYRRDHVPILGHFLHHPSGERHTIDFRDGRGVSVLAWLQHRWRHCVWTAFAAHAEMTCFLHLGLSLDDMRWLDLFAEARQITATHTHFFSRKGGLVEACQALAVPIATTNMHKEAMRLLILDKPADSHSPEDWDAIMRYCAEDVIVLPYLWQAICEVHRQNHKDYPLKAALFRTEYVLALAKLEFRSRGFPMDAPATNMIFDQHKAVRRFLAEECNAAYAGKVFRYNQKRDEYSLHMHDLIEYVDGLEFPVEWRRTATGKLDTSAEYLDEFVKTNPHFRPLRDTLGLLSQLKRSELREQMTADGWIKGVSIPFYTNSGRNQPLTSRGFVLNFPPWLRHLIRPEPDHVLIVADWSQQEIYLAAALSGDQNLRDALLTGDVYMALAAMADAVPPGATKKSHPAVRQAYKSTQLGIGYGMGAISLGKRIFLDQPADSNQDYEQCLRTAADLLQWHRRTFRTYWRYIDEEVRAARAAGWMRAKDGWTQFCDMNSKFTRLQNFPMQSNGAVILREAIKLLARHDAIELVCTLHDSIAIYCHADDAITHENILRRCMQEAGDTVMASTPMPMRIPVEVKVFDHASGYLDDRGTDMYRRVLEIVQHTRQAA